MLTFLITIFEPLYFVKMGQISSQTPLSKKSNTPLKLVFRQKLSQFCRLKIDDPYPKSCYCILCKKSMPIIPAIFCIFDEQINAYFRV